MAVLLVATTVVAAWAGATGRPFGKDFVTSSIVSPPAPTVASVVTSSSQVPAAVPSTISSLSSTASPTSLAPTTTTSMIPGFVSRSPIDPDHVAVWRVTTTQKVVALTFDDGPSPYTAGVMEALERAQVPATFFCLGQEAKNDPQTVARLRDAGFEVENHSWDHAYQTPLSYEAIRNEITSTEAILGPTKYFRPPHGFYNARVRQAVASLGLLLVRYNVDTRDWQRRGVPFVLSRVKSQIRPGSIIVMHDGGGDRSQTVQAIPVVVAWLRSHGYTFVTLDRLLTGGYGTPTEGRS